MRSGLSPRLLRAFFSPNCDENAIFLLKIYGANLTTPVYLCDNYTKRLASLTTDDEVVYGLTSEGIDHIFMPIVVSLPGDDEAGGARAEIKIHDASRYLVPIIRELSGPPSVRMQVVLQGTSAADAGEEVSAPELDIDGFELRGISYDGSTVTGVLVLESGANEPFPCHTMTPATNPELF